MTKSVERLCYCWYSPSMDQEKGHSIYLIGGVEQKVTVASSLSFEGGRSFCPADSVYLGVGKFFRQGEMTEAQKRWFAGFEELLNFGPDSTEEEVAAGCMKAVARLEELRNRHQSN